MLKLSPGKWDEDLLRSCRCHLQVSIQITHDLSDTQAIDALLSEVIYRQETNMNAELIRLATTKANI